MLQMQRISIPSSQVNFTDEQLETQKLSMWSCLAHSITPAVNRVVEFAKRVPSKSTFVCNIKVVRTRYPWCSGVKLIIQKKNLLSEMNRHGFSAEFVFTNY